MRHGWLKCVHNTTVTKATFVTLKLQSNVTVDRQTIACSPSPGRAFMGVLPDLFHDLGGELFVRDNKTIVIRNFNYDGLGPGEQMFLITASKHAANSSK